MSNARAILRIRRGASQPRVLALIVVMLGACTALNGTNDFRECTNDCVDPPVDAANGDTFVGSTDTAPDTATTAVDTEPGIDTALDAIADSSPPQDTAVDAKPDSDPTPMTDADAFVDAAPDSLLDSAVTDTRPDSASDPGDGGIDASDSGGPTGCAGSIALFCRDFDTVPSATTGWDYATRDPSPTAAVLALDNDALSAPKSLLATATAAGGAVTATLNHVFNGPTASAESRIDAWIKIDSLPAAGLSFLLLNLKREGSSDSVTFHVRPAGYYVGISAGSTVTSYPISTLPAFGKWTHVRMDVKMLVTGGSVRAWVDDMLTPAVDVTSISTATADTASRRLIVGLYTSGPTGSYTARYDDVSFSFK